MNNVTTASSIAKGIGRAYCRIPYISFLNNHKTVVKQLWHQRQPCHPFPLPVAARWQTTTTSQPVTSRLSPSPASQDTEITDFNLHQSSTDQSADLFRSLPPTPDVSHSPSEDARWSNRRAQQNFGDPASITSANHPKVDSPVLYQPVNRQFGMRNGKE